MLGSGGLMLSLCRAVVDGSVITACWGPLEWS